MSTVCPLSQLLGLASDVSTNISVDISDDRRLVHQGLAVVSGEIIVVTEVFDQHQAQVNQTSVFGLRWSSCVLYSVSDRP